VEREDADPLSIGIARCHRRWSCRRGARQDRRLAARQLAPRDFLIDPGIWIKDTRVEPAGDSDYRGRKLRLGPYLLAFMPPQLYRDHG
jgi:hypothetical protein